MRGNSDSERILQKNKEEKDTIDALNKEIDWNEFNKNLMALRNNKAVGTDGIKVEFLKNMPVKYGKKHSGRQSKKYGKRGKCLKSGEK